MTVELRPLLEECERIQEGSLWNATSHFGASTWASRIQAGAGAIPIILGGIGGARIISDPTFASPQQVIVAAVLALSAGIVGSLLSFWNLAKVGLEHLAAATKYKTLENEARRAREIHSRDDSYDAFKTRVLELAKRYDELGESSAQSGNLTFWLARGKIESGVFDTKVDERKRKRLTEGKPPPGRNPGMS